MHARMYLSMRTLVFALTLGLCLATIATAAHSQVPAAKSQIAKSDDKPTARPKAANPTPRKLAPVARPKAPSLRPKAPTQRTSPTKSRAHLPGKYKEYKPFWMHRFNGENWPVKFIPTLEFGFLAPLSHTIRFGDNGTNFDYIRDGGQDNLFVFLRLSLDLQIAKRHIVTFLYQPLDLRTEVFMRNEFKTDQATFPKNQAVNTRYGFDFFRVSYMYDVLSSPDMELAFGLSLQIRNATITFSSVDGSKRLFRNDVGPVPILKTRGRFMLPKRFWIGFEVDGFYAPVSFLNGSDQDIVGAIIDASLRVGKEITPLVDAFLNFRWIGGGSSGRDSKTTTPNSDGFLNNWLHVLSVSVGFTLR